MHADAVPQAVRDPVASLAFRASAVVTADLSGSSTCPAIAHTRR
jgi:hypothetical protein